jgi:hypothetical protein
MGNRDLSDRNVDERIALRKPRPRTPPAAHPVGRGFVLA